MTLFRSLNIRIARAGPRADRGVPARGRGGPPGRARRLGPRRCSSRPTRRAASSSPSATARRRSPATWRSARSTTIGLTERVGPGDRARGAGDGRQRRLRAVPRPRHRTRPTRPSGSARSVTTPAAVARHGAAMVRGLQSAGVAATVKHSPGKGHRRRPTPTTGWRCVDASRAVLGRPRVRAVPGRVRGRGPAGDVRPLRVARGQRPRRPAVDPVARRHDRPAARRPRLRGRDDLGRARHARPSPRARPRCSTSSPRCGPAWTCCSPRPIPRRSPASRTPWSARRPATCSTRPSWPPRTGGSPRSGRGWARPVPAPDLSVVGGAEHLALARELAARSITLVRDPAGRLPLPLASGPTGPRGHAATRGPHPGRHVVARRARRSPRRCAATFGTSTRSSWSRSPTTRRSPPSATARRSGLGAIVIGTIDGHRQPAQIALVEAVAAHRGTTRSWPSRCAARGTSRPTRPGVTALATYSILPGSLDALAAVLAGRAEAPGRLPVAMSSGGVASATAAATSGAATVGPVTLRNEIHEQPEVAERFLRACPGIVGPLADATPRARRRPRGHRRPRHDRPRRDLRPVRARGPARPAGRPRDPVGHVAVRRGASGSSGRSWSGSASRARRRTSWR